MPKGDLYLLVLLLQSASLVASIKIFPSACFLKSVTTKFVSNPIPQIYLVLKLLKLQTYPEVISSGTR